MGLVALVLLVPIGSIAGASGQSHPGMGSSVTSLKKAYGVDHGPGSTCSAKNSCFGPVLRNGDSGRTYEFTDVTVTSGIVAGYQPGYQQSFVKGTSAATAVSAIMRTMPAGSSATPIVIDDNGGSCGLFTISGTLLAKELGTPKIGDSQGTVGVELQHIDANLNSVYSPSNVQTATLSVTAFDPTQDC